MSIYETIGGDAVIPEAVEKFYSKLVADPVVGEFFQHTNVAKLISHQRMFLTAMLGGPDAYSGRDVRAAHAHLMISDTDFDLFLDHLAKTLAELGAAPERVAEALKELDPLRLEIVTAPADGADEWGSVDPAGGSG